MEVCFFVKTLYGLYKSCPSSLHFSLVMIQLGVNTVGNNKNDVPIFSLGARQPHSQALLPSNLQNKEGEGL